LGLSERERKKKESAATTPKKRKKKLLNPTHLVVQVAAAEHVLAVVQDLLEGRGAGLGGRARERDRALRVGGLGAVLHAEHLDVGLGHGAELLGDLLDDGGLVLLELADLVVEDDGDWFFLGLGLGWGFGERGVSPRRPRFRIFFFFSRARFRRDEKKKTKDSPLTMSSLGLGLAVAAAPTAAG
jgi:hypothetical protein